MNKVLEKKIFITHLTRMSELFICIAGLEINDKDIFNVPSNQIRPEFDSFDDRWEVSHLDQIKLYKSYSFTGHFQSKFNSKEDFIINDFKEIETNIDNNDIALSVDKYENFFPEIYTSNYEIFTEAEKKFLYKNIENNKNLERIISITPYYLSIQFKEGNQINSLATIEINDFIYYQKEKFNKDGLQQRIILFLQEEAIDLPITDIRFFDICENGFKNKSFEQIQELLQKTNIKFASIGLTKPMGDKKDKRYLQLNNLHFEPK